MSVKSKPSKNDGVQMMLPLYAGKPFTVVARKLRNSEAVQASQQIINGFQKLKQLYDSGRIQSTDMQLAICQLGQVIDLD